MKQIQGVNAAAYFRDRPVASASGDGGAAQTADETI